LGAERGELFLQGALPSAGCELSFLGGDLLPLGFGELLRESGEAGLVLVSSLSSLGRFANRVVDLADQLEVL
jgi:hypothetical protein